MYKLIALIGFVLGPVLITGYALHSKSTHAPSALPAVVGVGLVIVGVLSVLVVRDAARAGKARSTR